MSTFVEYQTRSILQSAQTPVKADEPPTPRQSRLHGFVGQLNTPLEASSLSSAISSCVRELDENISQDEQEEELEWAMLSRAVVGVYSEVMRVLLSQASQADDEAEWWRRVEQVGGGTAWYLLQTLPHRLVRLGNGMISTIRAQDRPVTFNTFSLQNIDRIFPPNLLGHLFRRSFFPHLAHPYNFLRTNPLELTRQECHVRREQLQKIRDQRAETLGKLVNLRGAVEQALASKGSIGERKENLATILELLEQSIRDDPSFPLVYSPEIPAMQPPTKMQLEGLSLAATTRIMLPRIQVLLTAELPAYSSLHKASIAPLQRPGRLTRLWPRFVFGPPVAYFIFKTLFNSRAELYSTLVDAKGTVTGFWYQWVVEPLASILRTVRSGVDENTRVVSPEGLHSDMDSLERMVVDLAREKLHYTPDQLQELTAQVRQGDLTPVLKIYENEIKKPITSMLTGNLIRSLLIQIHKTKVDVDVALTGIDRLLRSQELTFAFVGVAPSLAILYIFGGWVNTMWRGGKGKGRFGGLQNRETVWIAIRRIERLLNDPAAFQDSKEPSPLTQGLLLLSVAHLRSYATKHLPPRSQLQLGFLEDLDDLESKGKGREDRLRIVERMWRSWGRLLGWNGDAIGSR